MSQDLDFRERIILALDFSTREEVEKIVTELKGELKFVKVGMELYYSEGPEIIKYLKDQKLKIFLDLKIHDIPNTAFRAMRAVCDLGVDIINVHAAGGIQMMKAAKQPFLDKYGEFDVSNTSRPSATRPFIIGVTQLTSTDQKTMNDELGVPGSVKDSVLALAKNVKEAGLDGIVASPLEVPMIKEALGKDFITVTPGIRPASAKVNDQKRVTTPKDAIEMGTDYMVIGRAITQAPDPKKAFLEIVEDLNSLKV